MEQGRTIHITGRKARNSVKHLLGQKLDGAGVVEMVLIIVVLIGLVLIFKTQLTTLLGSIFGQINDAATGIY